ncbi:MAG: alpha/beta hydrolase [Acidimicrobiia bacterium]
MTPAVALPTVALAGDTCGEGDDLVLVHGLGASRHIWDDVRDDLATTWRVHRLELRGHGETGGPADPDAYKLHLIAADLAAAIEDRGGRDATVVAHSLGGAAALWAALRYPGAFGALVVVDAFTYGLPPARRAYLRRQLRDLRRRGPEGAWIAGKAARLADPNLALRWLDTDFAAARRAEALAVVPEAWEGLGEEVQHAPSFVSWLWQLDVELAVMAGADDTFMLGPSEEIAAVTGAPLHVLASMGHNPMIERPVLFARALRIVLEDL